MMRKKQAFSGGFNLYEQMIKHIEALFFVRISHVSIPIELYLDGKNA